ncbi:DNA-binding protein WhiA [Streptomyces sp. IBSNAI002]|uniref:DNA-binding protein WhiA n=1 Tax=Streptomyces sp. IBSNAI002 TaxID=3457500 RepID=UPI003FD6A4DA
MEMTAAARGELSRLPVHRPCCRKAEAAATLRFTTAGVPGRTQGVQAGPMCRATAERLRTAVLEVYGHRSDLVPADPTDHRQEIQYFVRVANGSGHLATQAGLVDGRGNPVYGLPPSVVSGPVCDAEAAWRGAFLASGTLAEPGRHAGLEVLCPGQEVALALVGAARRLSIPAKIREPRMDGERPGAVRVVIKDASAISAMLGRIGARSTAARWSEAQMTYEEHGKQSRTPAANSLANCTDNNLHRSARAAVVVGARARRALEILGGETPEHLAAAARLRIEHDRASLDELAALATPPMTKDKMAGRIRRLLSMADRHAKALGIPDTRAHLTGADDAVEGRRAGVK